MGSDVGIESLKKKFEDLSNMQQDLSNKKIGLESEIKTVEGDMEDITKKLLEITETDSLKDAVEYYNTLKTNLENSRKEIDEELDRYLKDDISDKGRDEFNIG